ncbi:hypothetical protein JD276_09115 [Leucobacter sp. CSA1]|uniref:DUF6993 domain-containing protein n=1 Tax=Leucobacter chromiisoli TaxID=2796471 RepID=A0A934UVR9_9MICO|nr:hypothetical protein [Leucobacter chromiisoli]MBK0419192.1 hypothetical protein [Leucobacter chromiisoli]
MKSPSPSAPTLRRAPARTRGGRAALAAAALLAAAPLLAGCFLLEGPTPETPPRETPAEPEVAPELVPGGSAEENLPFFTETLRAYAAGEGAIQGQPVVDAVAAAGFDRTTMQVSFDQSRTGLPADSIFVAVRIESDCLIGQLVPEDRSFTAEAMPAVGPEQNVCLIGETRPIDW